MQIKTDGIVLREVQTSEADTIVTILTRDRGIISGFVGNARKLRSRKAAVRSSREKRLPSASGAGILPITSRPVLSILS